MTSTAPITAVHYHNGHRIERYDTGARRLGRLTGYRVLDANGAHLFTAATLTEAKKGLDRDANLTEAEAAHRAAVEAMLRP